MSQQTEAAKDAAALLVSAERHLQEEAYGDALQQASQALELYRLHENLAGEADALRLKIGSLRVAALYILSANELSGESSPWQAEEKRQEALEAAESMALEEQMRFRKLDEQRGEALMLLALADIFCDQKGSQKALNAKDAAEQALHMLREVADRRMEANALLTLVYVHAKLGEGDQACNAAAEAVTAFRMVHDQLGEARALHAQAALFEGLRKDGTPFAKEAAELFRAADCPKMLASELQSIAHWYLWNHKPREALPFALESHQLFKDMTNDLEMHPSLCSHYGELLPANQASAMSTVAKCLTGREDFEKALKWCTDAVEKSKAKSDLHAQVLCLHILISTQIEQDCNCCHPGDFVAALQAAEDGVVLSQRIGNKSWEASMHHSAALANAMMSRSDDALQEAQLSRKILQDLGDQKGEAAVLRTLADLHVHTKDLNKASYIAAELLGLWQAMGDRGKQASALLLMAEVQHMKETEGSGRKRTFSRQQQNIHPMSAATEALEVFQEEGNLRKAVSTWGFISRYHRHEENLQDAIQAAQMAAELCAMDGNFRMQARYLQQTVFLFSKQHPGAATSAAEQALIAARAARSVRLEVEMLILVSQSFSAKTAKEAAETTCEAKLFESEMQAMRPAREAVMLARKLKGKHHLPWALYALAEAHLVGGRGEEGLRAAEEAARCTHTPDEAGQATCLLLAAEAHFFCNRPLDAVRTVNVALQLFVACGDGLGEAQTREALARFQKLPALTGAAALQDTIVVGCLTASTALKDIEAQAPQGLSLVDTQRKVLDLARELCADDELDEDSPLMDSGIDSLASVAFADSLSKAFSVRIQPQIIFDFPSVKQVAEFLVAESQTPM